MFTLITAASAAQAYQLERLLDTTDTVIFADSVDLPQFMLKQRRFIKIPAGNSPTFAHQLLTLCLDMQITSIFPLRRLEIMALAEARQLFEEYNIQVMVPLREELPLLFDKGIIGEVMLNTVDQSKTNAMPIGVYVQNTNLEYQLFTAD